MGQMAAQLNEEKQIEKLSNYPNLNRGGPGRPKGCRNKSTRLREALSQVKDDINILPKDLQHECMDYISKEEWVNTLRTAKKEETKIALIKEWWDRRLPKIPVSVALDSHSTQITGTLVDLLSLLRSSNEPKQLTQSNQDVIDAGVAPIDQEGTDPEGEGL